MRDVGISKGSTKGGTVVFEVAPADAEHLTCAAGVLDWVEREFVGGVPAWRGVGRTTSTQSRSAADSQQMGSGWRRFLELRHVGRKSDAVVGCLLFDLAPAVAELAVPNASVLRELWT